MPDLPICIGGYRPCCRRNKRLQTRTLTTSVSVTVSTRSAHCAASAGTQRRPADGMWEKLVDGEIYQTEAHQIGDLKALPFPDYDVFSKEDGFKDVNSSIFGPRETGVAGYDRPRLSLSLHLLLQHANLEGWRSKKEFLRKYEPEAMVMELERLRDEYDVGYFEFWDELFVNLKFVRAFLEIYKERIGLPFSINSAWR